MISRKLYLFFTLFLVNDVFAAKETCSNKEIIRFTSHIFTSNSVNSSWNNAAYIQLDSCQVGTTSCVQSNGLARLTIPAENTQVFSMALAAYMSGKKVSVTFDDSEKHTNGDCTVAWFHLDGR